MKLGRRARIFGVVLIVAATTLFLGPTPASAAGCNSANQVMSKYQLTTLNGDYTTFVISRLDYILGSGMNFDTHTPWELKTFQNSEFSYAYNAIYETVWWTPEIPTGGANIGGYFYVEYCRG